MSLIEADSGILLKQHLLSDKIEEFTRYLTYSRSAVGDDSSVGIRLRSDAEAVFGSSKGKYRFRAAVTARKFRDSELVVSAKKKCCRI